MNLFLKLVSSPWFWLDIALSVTGGIIVWWGLKIEKRAEKLMPPESFKPDLFEDIISNQKAELDRGWRILMFGILFEVVAAFGISVISGLEIADLSETTTKSMERTALVESNNLVLRSNVVALEAAVQWRTITTAEATNVINLLAPVASVLPSGQKSVSVMAEGADNPETRRYANRIVEVLRGCGFDAHPAGGLRIGTTQSGIIGAEGVWIEVRNRTNPPPHALPILRAFQSLKTKSLVAKQDTGTAEGLVVIRVLAKPEN